MAKQILFDEKARQALKRGDMKAYRRLEADLEAALSRLNETRGWGL